ncbi:serine hydrolase domain-containing protein [Devriesea agamarum]|uniref:serine hydrolase domain-containing protein n=1 Tax=Devriesea agamarum TaxID=472569 RepID=UPI000A5472AA|nr:serine hydrolase domain-containing protein [Devriesea agamarum]
MSSIPVFDEFPFSCALGVTDARGTGCTLGDPRRPYPLASVSKPITAMSAWIAVERELLDLDAAAGPPGATVRHLLSHAAGLAFSSDDVLSAPGRRRTYSNRGFEILGDQIGADTGYDPLDWIERTVVEPLGMADAVIEGSPAAGFCASVLDLLALGRELLCPTLVSPQLHRLATHVVFEGLPGVLPGYGRQEHNDWGLGVEIRAQKSPHWTGSGNSPGTFGHFGQSGSFLWVDPEAGVACAFLGEQPFGEIHQHLWSRLSDEVLGRFADADRKVPAR